MITSKMQSFVQNLADSIKSPFVREDHAKGIVEMPGEQEETVGPESSLVKLVLRNESKESHFELELHSGGKLDKNAIQAVVVVEGEKPQRKEPEQQEEKQHRSSYTDKQYKRRKSWIPDVMRSFGSKALTGMFLLGKVSSAVGEIFLNASLVLYEDFSVQGGVKTMVTCIWCQNPDQWEDGVFQVEVKEETGICSAASASRNSNFTLLLKNGGVVMKKINEALALDDDWGLSVHNVTKPYLYLCANERGVPSANLPTINNLTGVALMNTNFQGANVVEDSASAFNWPALLTFLAMALFLVIICICAGIWYKKQQAKQQVHDVEGVLESQGAGTGSPFTDMGMKNQEPSPRKE